MVGLDIVVFDPINHRLYNNTLEFVNVFRDSFSKNEFDAILSSGTLTNPVLQPPAAATTTTTKPLCDRDDHSQLRELYLRWAVKEAYTKALGIGMGFDFSSFETTLNQLGNNTNSSIWHWLLDTNTTNQPSGRQTTTTTTTNTTGSSSSSPIRFTTGTVTQLHDSADATLLPRRPTQEQWAFIFHPLYSTTSISSTTKEENEKDMLGCACVCVGPLSNDNHFNMQDMELDVDWSSLQELIQFHVRDS
jgi:4'-phosphopantetheinyl transferase